MTRTQTYQVPKGTGKTKNDIIPIPIIVNGTQTHNSGDVAKQGSVRFNALGIIPFAKKFFSKKEKQKMAIAPKPLPEGELVISFYDSTKELLSTEILSLKSENEWETLAFSAKAEEKGFVSASIRGTSSEPAKFDDFSIQLKSLYSAKLYQENHYYPFGMNMKGLESSDKQTQQNKKEHEFQFNAQTEREESFGLFWDETPFRAMDMQLGRFWGVDKMAEIAPSLTPFRFGFNNPILYNDPSGLWEKTATGWKTDDVDEMKVFFQAWNRAGSEREIIDAEEGDEDNELFRIVGTGEVGIIHGKEKSHPNAKFRINSKKSKGETQKILHNNPVLGDMFKAGTEFESGNYIRGGLYFTSQVLSLSRGGKKGFSKGAALVEGGNQLLVNSYSFINSSNSTLWTIIDLDIIDIIAAGSVKSSFGVAGTQSFLDLKLVSGFSMLFHPDKKYQKRFADGMIDFGTAAVPGIAGDLSSKAGSSNKKVIATTMMLDLYMKFFGNALKENKHAPYNRK